MRKSLIRSPLSLLFSLLLVFSLLTPSAYAIDGVYHYPYGWDDPYNIQPTELSPRDPMAGDTVYVHITTWPIESGQTAWVTWTKNGVTQPAVGASWDYNSGNNTYWVANLGTFAKGDVVTYTVHGNKDGANQKDIGPYTFKVTGWESVASVSSITNSTNHVVLNAVANTGTYSPKINIAFTADDVFRVQLSPNGSGTFATGLSNYTVTDNSTQTWINTSKLMLKVTKNPFRLDVYKPDGTTLIAREYDSATNRNMAWATDGSSVITRVEDHLYSPSTEAVMGLGEHYDQLNKRGQVVQNYDYNQYKNQASGDKTYMSIPFFLNSNGYGIYVNSTYYSKFDLANSRTDMLGFTVNTSGSTSSLLDYYFVGGDDLKGVVANYATLTAKPNALPKWAYGLWVSANEWSTQAKVNTVVNNLNTYQIPASSLVLEQWSDENTFYIFNDAQYTPKTGSQAFAYTDFTFPVGGKWPNPKQMADNLHSNGLKLTLWQVPIEKYITGTYTQKDNDEAYMLSQGYAVGNGSGGAYRIPNGSGWFDNSLLLDFTNPTAVNWWMSKRAYLFDGVGIDGFKTDGGEMVWGRVNTFSNGKKGDEMRNQYPNDYVGAYNNYAATKKSGDSVTFSRSGTQKAQQNQIFWAGDQESSFTAFQQAMKAGLSAGISGVPYWTWDMAGFSGDVPTVELYKRGFEMSTFAPIMQFHSEKADPSQNNGFSAERTPWNTQSRYGDSTVIPQFTKYANIRYNLLPYIFSEGTKTANTGVPMMRALPLEYPTDSQTYNLSSEYMFGDNLLVAPVINQGETVKDVYLPAGDWIDFFYGAQRPGGRHINYNADVDTIPVFVKAGSILPMNLNAQYQLGGTIGNSMTSYNNLIFRVYPYGTTSYAWNDDVGGSVKTITSTEQYGLNKETVDLPAINSTKTLQVFTTQPSSVTVGGTTLTSYSSLSSLIAASTGWYYDPVQKFTYVKLAASASAQSVVLNGVNKVEYEAEFATLTNVSTNTNHTGYMGTGFVDGFAEVGDSVSFDVSVKAAGTYTVKLRYSSAGGNASRAIYVNGTKITDATLSATANWDTWGTTSLTLSLNAGMNTIKISYDASNSLGINLDQLAVIEH
ncbi:TIM-barrel domain-containing protein [Gorillibacterium massiliense]|uniref:TIM-barrel domain-containing protein n=1 Tax=Gorillibacterium massiliense TaxID=1280390 RepID=UPI0004B62358|nr:TIM-barrel domain-containing protein [Gorillibacterium massiliense]